MLKVSQFAKTKDAFLIESEPLVRCDHKSVRALNDYEPLVRCDHKSVCALLIESEPGQV